MAFRTKIDDVKKANKVAPSATSRPILVTEHPVLSTDPMVTSETADAAASRQVMVHTTKTIQPLGDNQAESTEPTVATSSEDTTSAETTQPSADPVDASAEKATAEPAPAEPAEPEVGVRDTEAASTAAEAAAEEARAAREQELEELVESGKYAVPINAVQRKRSHMYGMLLFVVGLLLVAALADAALDTGLLTAPDSIPHTHFFTNQ